MQLLQISLLVVSTFLSCSQTLPQQAFDTFDVGQLTIGHAEEDNDWWGALEPILGCVGRKKYYLETEIRHNWFDAFEYCKENNMELASIQTYAEHKFLDVKLGQRPYNQTQMPLWTSGNDFGHEGQFNWMSSGRKMGYSAWQSPQPDNYQGNQDCVTLWDLNPTAQFRTSFDDDWCTTKHFFLCETIVSNPQDCLN